MDNYLFLYTGSIADWDRVFAHPISVYTLLRDELSRCKIRIAVVHTPTVRGTIDCKCFAIDHPLWGSKPRKPQNSQTVKAHESLLWGGRVLSKTVRLIFLHMMDL